MYYFVLLGTGSNLLSLREEVLARRKIKISSKYEKFLKSWLPFHLAIGPFTVLDRNTLLDVFSVIIDNTVNLLIM